MRETVIPQTLNLFHIPVRSDPEKFLHRKTFQDFFEKSHFLELDLFTFTTEILRRQYKHYYDIPVLCNDVCKRIK